jgi:predicted small metal-binding protein
MELKNLIRSLIEESLLEEGKADTEYSHRANEIIDDIISDIKSRAYDNIKNWLGIWTIDIDKATNGKYFDLLNYRGMTLKLIITDESKDLDRGFFDPDTFRVVFLYKGEILGKPDLIKAIDWNRHTIAHEITHAIVYNQTGGKNIIGYKRTGDGSTWRDYYNQAEEINANYIATIARIVRYIKADGITGNKILDTYDNFFYEVSNGIPLRHLKPKIKKKLQSRAYITWQQLREELWDYNAVKNSELIIDAGAKKIIDDLEEHSSKLKGIMKAMNMTLKEAFMFYVKIKHGFRHVAKSDEEQIDEILEGYWDEHKETIYDIIGR